jgi:hypothetical protein
MLYCKHWNQTLLEYCVSDAEFRNCAAVSSLAEQSVSVIYTGNQELCGTLCLLSGISNSIAWLLSALRGTLCWSQPGALSGSQVPSTSSRKCAAIYSLITNTDFSLSYRAHYLLTPNFGPPLLTPTFSRTCLFTL